MNTDPRKAAGLNDKAAIGAIGDEQHEYESWSRAVDYHVRNCTGVASEDYPPECNKPGRMRRWFKAGIEASEVAACIVHEIVRAK
jgi:hypothetical protein